jgi:hypothetical protein
MFREDLFYRCRWCPSSCRRSASAAPTSRSWRRTFSGSRCNGARPPDDSHHGRGDGAALGIRLARQRRELENLIERLVVLADEPLIRADDLPIEVRPFISEKRIPQPHLPEDGIDLNKAVLEFEQRLISEALRRTKGNKQAAARLLGLGRTTLVAKLRRLPADVPKAS